MNDNLLWLFEWYHKQCDGDWEHGNGIKIGITGKILEGRHKGWYICVEDDFENTGGYLILVFNDCNRLNSSEGYDRWAEDKNILLEMFKSAEWEIQWLDEKSFYN